VDYEHIEPEFHDAKVHDPDKMTLLCVACHSRVTRKLISKKAIWEAKANPKALQDGFVQDALFVNTDDMEVKIGNSRSKNTKTVLTIYGKPIVWFEQPLIRGEPIKLCAIFHDENGKLISYVNRNQFFAYTSNYDVKSESTRLRVDSNAGVSLEIIREGGEVLSIPKMRGRYLNAAIMIGSKGELIIEQGGSSFILDSLQVENCGSAIYLGAPPAIVKYNKICLAIALAKNGRVIPLIDHRKNHVGWFFAEEIFNKKYELVGFVRDNKVFNLVGEHIGALLGGSIVHYDDCYESGEPIYTSVETTLPIGFDVSFRLFGSVL